MSSSKVTPNVGIAHIITHVPTGMKTICVSRKQTAVRLQQIAKGLGQADITYIDEKLIPLIASGRLTFKADDVMSTLKVEIQEEATVDQFISSVIDYHKLDVAAPTNCTKPTDETNLADDSEATESTDFSDTTKLLSATDSTCVHLKSPEREAEDAWDRNGSGLLKYGERRTTDDDFDRLFDEA